MKKISILCVFAIIITTHAHAKKTDDQTLKSTRALIATCKMTETVSLSINFNTVVATPSKAKETFDEMIAKVKKTADELKVEGLTIQSMNYNVNPNQNGSIVTGYLLSGSVAFILKDVEKASNVMEKLNAQGMTSSLSVSAYQNGNCAPQLLETDR